MTPNDKRAVYVVVKLEREEAEECADDRNYTGMLFVSREQIRAALNGDGGAYERWIVSGPSNQGYRDTASCLSETQALHYADGRGGYTIERCLVIPLPDDAKERFEFRKFISKIDARFDASCRAALDNGPRMQGFCCSLHGISLERCRCKSGPMSVLVIPLPDEPTSEAED